jgi:hypothetical protein
MDTVVLMKRLFIVIIICLPAIAFSDDKLDFKTIDSITYHQFQNKEWKALIQSSKIGLENGIDYYYLRMRKGIAELELRNYINASIDFEKAIEFNTYDKTAKLYLYNSLINSGRKKEAYRLSSTFSKSLKEELDIQKKVLSDLYFFGGYSISNNDQKNGSLNMLGDSAIYGEQLLMGNQKYFHLGSTLNIAPSLSFYASLSYLNIGKKNRFHYKLYSSFIESTDYKPGGSYDNVFGTKEELVEQVFDDQIRQTEFYLNGNLLLKKAWSINLFANLLFASTTQYKAHLVSYLKRDTLSYNSPLNEYLIVNREEFDYEINAIDTSFMDWVVGFNLQKDFKYIILGLSTTMSKIYESQNFQSSLSATYYPFGNLKFYGMSILTFYHETDTRLSNDASHFIFSQTIGIQTFNRLWLEGEYIFGNMKNVNFKQGLVVHNLSDNINYIVGAKLYIFVNTHITLDLVYQLSDRTGYYTSYTNDFRTFSTKYQTHSIIGGIKWTL